MDQQMQSVDFELTDDDVLKLTQSTRYKLVNAITAEGMPVDKGDRMVLLTALADMDRTALGNKKIGAKDKNTAAVLLAAQIFERLSNQFGNRSPFEAPNSDVSDDAIPVLSAEALPESEIGQGETEIGISQENYDEFMSRMESTKQ